MRHLPGRFLLSLGCWCLLILPAAAQDYRKFFEQPKTAQQFWEALNFEVNVGKFDIASEYLKGFMKVNPTDEELLEIESHEGISTFLRLLTIPELRADAKPLVERVTAAVKKKLSDPERIRKFVKNLAATPEERVYAIGELRRSGPIVVPFMVETLRSATDASDRMIIQSVFLQLNHDIVPPLLAALDINDPALQVELIEVLWRRRERAAIPYLWYLSASPKQADAVRQKASDVLIALLGVGKDKLPPAKVALTREAERYYRHQVRFIDPKEITLWQWDGKQFVLPAPVVTSSVAEEFFGLRFARQAIELDPAYEPAQVLFMSLALEKGFEKAGIDQPLEKGAPAVKELTKVVNPELLLAVLDKALQEKRIPVILGSVRALGELTEGRAVRSEGGETPLLVRALHFPDQRVQVAAADSLLRISETPSALANARVVDIFRRVLAADPKPRALIVDAVEDRASAVGKAVREAGYDVAVNRTGRSALLRLKEAADISIVLVDSGVFDPELPFFLGQMRSDVDLGLLPVIVTLSTKSEGASLAEQELRLNRLVESYPNVWVIRTSVDGNELKGILGSRISEAVGRPLSEEERKGQAGTAILWLKRMAIGETPGYDVRPAEAAILKATASDELGPLAFEAAGHLPGRKSQRQLASIVLDKSRRPELRAGAANELSHSIHLHGTVLTGDQVKGLEELFASAEDARVKSNLALVLGSMRPTAAQTGSRLQRYIPTLPTPAPVAPAGEAAPAGEPPPVPAKEK